MSHFILLLCLLASAGVVLGAVRDSEAAALDSLVAPSLPEETAEEGEDETEEEAEAEDEEADAEEDEEPSTSTQAAG